MESHKEDYEELERHDHRDITASLLFIRIVAAAVHIALYAFVAGAAFALGYKLVNALM